MVFLLGKSGSGKSTLLNIIGGLDGYDQGDVKIFGKSTKDFNEKAFDDYRNTYIGFIFQEYHLIETYSVYKNIALALELQGKKATKETVLEVLKQVELEAEIDRMPYELSGGQKQRVAIARALIKNPKVLLADEPTGSLDSETSKQILELLRKLSKDKLVLVVSHDREFAYSYGDRVIEIADGKIIKDTNPPISATVTASKAREFVKAKLPFVDALSLALTSLKIKPARLIFTIFLSLFAFVLFGIVDTIASYDNIETIVKSTHENGDTHMPLTKQLYDPLNEYYENACMSSNDIAWLKEKFPNRKYFPVISERLDIIRTIYGSPTGADEYYAQSFSGFVEITKEFVDTFGFELFGNFPTKDSEVVIPYYIYEVFEDFEYREGEFKFQIEKPQDLIGRKLTFGESFTIVGILDTNFDSERFAPLHDTSADRYHQYFHLLHALNQIKSGSVHTYLYVNEGYYERNFYQEPKTSLHFSYIDIVSTTDLKDYKQMNEAPTIGEAKSIRVMDKLPEHVNLKDKTQTMIRDDEVLLSYNSVSDWHFFENKEYDDYIYDKTLELVTEFALEHFDEIKEDFEFLRGESTYQDYVTYIFNQKTYNQYHPEYTREYFEVIAKRSYLDEVLFNKLDLLGIRLQNEISNRYTGLKFAGFFEGQGLLVTQKGMDRIIEEGSYYDFKLVIINLSDNVNDDIRMMKKIAQTDLKFYIDNDVAFVFMYADNALRIGSLIALGASLIFAIFASLLFYNFMSISINHKKKDIGILRAIGATRFDVYKIFFSEAVMIALVIYSLSLVSVIIGVNIINNYISQYFFMSAEVMWEYKTIIIKAKASLMGGKFDSSKIDAELNVHGNNGWELVSVVTSNRGYGESGSLI